MMSSGAIAYPTRCQNRSEGRGRGKPQTCISERMTKKAPATSPLLIHSPSSTNEFTAYSAQDSMSMVATATYNPLIPLGEPVAARRFLLPRKSRRTITRVRRTLSETATEIHGILYLRRRMAQVWLTGCDIWWMTKIPDPILLVLVNGVSPERGHITYQRTQGTRGRGRQ